MSSNNRTILRGVILGIYIILTGLVLYGIGSVWSYLNTGADRGTMLHTEIKQVEQYLPELRWAPLKNDGRPMDDQTLTAIENDYLDAWFVKQVAFKSNSRVGIDDYFTKSARLNLFNIIDHNSANNISIESTTLHHEPNLEFFSEDGQMIVLTDHNVIEYKRLFKDNQLISEINELNSYRVIMLLEDGFWRIRHMIKLEANPKIDEEQSSNFKIDSLKGINYYPQDSPWDMFGDQYDKTIINSDFELISEAGLNSIRIFIPYEDFGKSEVKPEKLKKLSEIMDLASANNLKVLVTLFDFYGDYSVLDWTLNQRHAKLVVNSLKDHEALLGWDVKNEPNLDFESRGQDLVEAWLLKTIQFVRELDSEHPITIGWSNVESATILKEELDFISFHYYEKIEDLEVAYDKLKNAIGNEKSIVITEFGMSSYDGLWYPIGGSEEDQATYHKTMQTLFAKNDIQFMSWTLYDFNDIPKEVVGRLPWRKNAQMHFGFIDKDGEKKPSFSYISSKE